METANQDNQLKFSKENGTAIQNEEKSVVNVPSEVKQNICEICASRESKYKCPKCLVKTCSLPCVKKHKELKNCDGVRCKTAYIPLSLYNESTMLSDYRLLEEISRCAANNGRDIAESLPTTTKGMSLQLHKARIMNINLKLLPYTFTQHKMNSTFFNRKLRAFLWHVVWVFPTLNLSLHKKKILDSKVIKNALIETCKTDTTEHPSITSYLESSDICIFMKRMDLPANQTMYHKVDPEATIKSSLQGKTIVEYPQFIIVMRHEAAEYEANCFEGKSPGENNATKVAEKRTDICDETPKKKRVSDFTNKEIVSAALEELGAVESFP